MSTAYPPKSVHKLTRAQLITLCIALEEQRDRALAGADTKLPTTEWGVRREADSACYSREQAERTIEIQRKRRLNPVLIRRQVGPWEVAEP
jgi:hypothetical protein